MSSGNASYSQADVITATNIDHKLENQLASLMYIEPKPVQLKSESLANLIYAFAQAAFLVLK